MKGLNMISEEDKIKQLITSLGDTVSYTHFKTLDEYLLFREARKQSNADRELQSITNKLNMLSEQNCCVLKDWVDLFDSFDTTSKMAGYKGTKTYSQYLKMVRDKKIPDVIKFPLLLNIYLYMDVKPGCHKHLLQAYKKLPVENKKDMQTEIALKLKGYLDENNYVTVYRGIYENRWGKSSIELDKAVSFTLDYNKALFFACNLFQEKSYIYQAKVSLENIIYYTDERDEQEVIIKPLEQGGKLMNLTVKEVIRQEYVDSLNITSPSVAS
jgi:hypothetical protein